MATPTSSSQPTSQDIVSRNIVIEGDAHIVERMRKQANIRDFTILCDEGVAQGGDGSAPPPLVYFASSILF